MTLRRTLHPSILSRIPPDESDRTISLVAIMSLGTAWSPTSPFGPSLDPKAVQRPAALRKHIAAAVELLANAGKRRPEQR